MSIKATAREAIHGPDTYQPLRYPRTCSLAISSRSIHWVTSGHPQTAVAVAVAHLGVPYRSLRERLRANTKAGSFGKTVADALQRLDRATKFSP
jgi:hypothetical protein